MQCGHEEQEKFAHFVLIKDRAKKWKSVFFSYCLIESRINFILD
jgi:hypothetical protein